MVLLNAPVETLEKILLEILSRLSVVDSVC